jgi:eukaryotic-like serine/threonine-protein kinase
MINISDRARWHKLKNILADALEETSSPRRTEALRRACTDDASLLQEAEALLNQDTTSLEHFAEFASSCLRDELPTRVGERLGAYAITGEIGRGGMGAVYLAKRADGQFEKQVAIKILKRGTDTEEVLRRFRAERQILANLEHANITRLLDAGVTSDNLPYVVMEFVDGRPITKFVEEEGCPLSQQMTLFLKVCAAVELAHAQGVIHRDIKPSNVLVKRDSEVKLLDFGIAKVLASENDDVTVAIERRLTPKYAAPEQSTSQQSTIATDVYSLGVLLSELLDAAPKPLATNADGAMGRCLRDVALHATQVNPQKRYPSAGALADSVRECLSDRAALSSRSRPAKRKSSLLAIAAGVILLALLFSATIWQKRRSVGKPSAGIVGSPAQSPPSEKIDSIAILPFQPIGSENNDELLGLGMADAVIGQVSKIKQINVLPTSAVLKYKGRTDDALAAARELKADAVLTGTVQRSGDRVRINVQLISARNGRTLWTEKFDETFTDVFGIQDSISSEITKALALGLSPEQQKQIAKRYTSNTDAYDAYLMGIYFYNKRSKEGLQKAVDYFQEAVTKDPEYALAYALLADCYNLQAYYMYLPSTEAMPKCKAAAERALALDNTLAEAYVAMAGAQVGSGRDSRDALRRALELNSNLPIAHQRYAWALSARGQLGEALSHMKRAQELDPLSATNNSALGSMFIFGRQFPEALLYCARAAELDPNSPAILGNLAEAYFLNGMYDKALQAYRRFIEINPDEKGNAQAGIAAVLYKGNRRNEADAMMPEILRLAAEKKADAYSIAMLYAIEEKIDDALQWFEQALQKGQAPSMFVRYAPEFDSLRRDPRFKQMLVKYARGDFLDEPAQH